MTGKIEVLQADITRVAVDAIVNAANSTLLGGGGVDGAIHRAAGPQLLEACRQLGGCPTGQARITAAFALPARFVIHAVGPVWQGGGAKESDLLASCYDQALALARANGCQSIAFPAISCGVYGYPAELAVPLAVARVSAFLARHPELGRVVFTAFDDRMLDLYRRELK